jgi:hypothetical protein
VDAGAQSLRSEYQRRLEARNAARAAHDKSFVAIGNWRLAVVVIGAGLAWWNIWTLPFSVAVFVALIVWHERVLTRSRAEARAAAFYEQGIARLEGRWAGAGATGDRFRDASHPYEGDLDLFGRGSLFELIGAARTSVGEETLAAWLKGPASAETVIDRQQAVAELRDRLDLREDLALLGEDVRKSVDPRVLARWGEGPMVRLPRFAQYAAFAAAALNVIAIAGYMLHFWRFPWVAGSLALSALVAVAMRQQVFRVLAAVDAPAEELDVLARVFESFERESFSGGRLAHLRAELEDRGAAPSRRIAGLHRLIEYHDWTRNQGFALFAKPLMWSTQFAIAIEMWRRRNGPQIARWLAAVGELEALCSIAGYAAEHPSDPFPGLSNQGPQFCGSGIAHPLLDPAAAVRNDVCLNRDLQLLVVSGSNMSGKSTLLRAVGLNTALAWAGAPVRAQRLTVSPLAIGASMRTHDSVLEGKSRFYAEITRIRQVVDLADGERPLLFLLDEVLSGTNSHDRRIGAAAILHTLVAHRAIGLVTTHDLALAEVADELAPRAANVHFEDHLEDGVIAFDYRMRPGVVAKSNALELMRSVGLEV